MARQGPQFRLRFHPRRRRDRLASARNSTIRATPAPGCADAVACTRLREGISFPVNGTIVLRVGNFEAGRHQRFYGENTRPKCGFCARHSSDRTTSRARRRLKFRPHCAGSNCDCSSTTPSPGPQKDQAAPLKRRSGKGSKTRERLRLLASDVPLIKIAAFIEPKPPHLALVSYFLKHRKPKKVTANLAAVSLAARIDRHLCDAANWSFVAD